MPVTVRGFPRIHMTLLDLGHATARSYGGLGFSLNHAPVEVRVEHAARMTWSGLNKLDKPARSELRIVAQRLRRQWRLGPAHVSIASMPEQHVGLGSKTALLLSTLQALSILFEISPTERQLQTLSGRGGASGIGLHAFFHGGLIADAGHPHHPGSLAPSSARRDCGVPLLAARHKMPNSWETYLVRPNGRILAGEQERRFFIDHTPIPKPQVLQALACVYHAILPAVAEMDFGAFRSAVNHLSTTGFKRREVSHQFSPVRQTLAALRNLDGVAAGMSSLGPTLYAIIRKDDTTARHALHRTCHAVCGAQVAMCRARNQGFEVRTS